VAFGIPVGLPASDGTDIWMPADNTVGRFRASDGRLLETWPGATNATAAIAGLGIVWVTGSTDPGSLYKIRELFPPAPVNIVATNLGGSPYGLAFDGAAVWTASTGGSVSTVTVGANGPFPVTTVTTGFNSPLGALYDGASVWVTDNGANTLLKLD